MKEYNEYKNESGGVVPPADSNGQEPISPPEYQPVGVYDLYGNPLKDPGEAFARVGMIFGIIGLVWQIVGPVIGVGVALFLFIPFVGSVLASLLSIGIGCISWVFLPMLVTGLVLSILYAKKGNGANAGRAKTGKICSGIGLGIHGLFTMALMVFLVLLPLVVLVIVLLVLFGVFGSGVFASLGIPFLEDGDFFRELEDILEFVLRHVFMV